jgi:citrate lyase beta subunit
MLKSYFFIPANNLKFLKKIKELPANYIVFDLEDAVLGKELNECFSNLSSIKIEPNYFVRLQFFDNETLLNEIEFNFLLNLGFKNFIIPKYSGVEQARVIGTFLQKYKCGQGISFVLLVEDPLSLLLLLESLKCKPINITGLGLGSHDYCNSMGMKHSSHNLYFARQLILNYAKAFDLDAIDTVSVDIEADLEFCNESLDAFNMGFTSKFLIHPRQLKNMNEIKYYTNEEVEEAEKVYDKIIAIKTQKKAIVRIDGKVYEKPHVNRIINIIKWKNTYGSK